MKKLVFLGSAIGSLLTPAQVLAQTLQINRPVSGNRNVGYSNLGEFISNALTLAFIVAIIVVLVMLIIGAYEWITSGGDKEAVGKARNRIINALIGLAVLAVAFALTNLAANFLGFQNINQVINIPTPQQ